MSTSLLNIKATSEASSAERQRSADRKRNILVLINQHLIENGYVEAAERLQREAGGVLNKFTAADNIDLNLVMTEYEAYYEMRFDKKPKLARKLLDGEDHSGMPSAQSSRGRGQGKKSNGSAGKEGSGSSKLPNIPTSGGNNSDSAESDAPASGFSVAGMSISGSKRSNNAVEDPAVRLEERLLKPPPQFGGDPELKQLANVICREIYQQSPNIRFDDIVELAEAKRLLIEAVQLPIRFPYLFTGILRPWRGILLHGPPGTGKTLLAKAVATECHTTFFNISASTLVSKWRGDSEKLVRVLFDVARYHAPSTIFLDEIDSILTSRDGEGGEHEASRRMKTELLIQMDGVKTESASSLSSEGATSQQVFVMAASNLPWDLDIAVLRRLEKRVFVPLPSQGARKAMFEKHLNDRIDNTKSNSVDFEQVASATEGYSGADIELVCRESAMMPVRRLMHKLESINVGGHGAVMPDPPPGRPANGGPRKQPLPSAVTGIASPNDEIFSLLRADPVTAQDIQQALNTTKPSSDGRHEK